MGTNTLKRIAAIAALVLVAGPAGAQTSLRLISGWPPNTSMIRTGEAKYIANIEAASDGAITFVRNGPETVPPFEQLQPLSAGVFDLMYSTPAYHQADTGVGAVMDGLLSADPAKLREDGVIAWLDAYYRETFGITLLALVPAPSNQILLREPLGSDGTLAGRKIRSNAAFEGIVRGLGGAPVGLPAPEIYAALQKGVVDGAAIPEHAAADYKLYEVGNYITRPAFGHTTLILMANADAFDALPDDVRTVLQEEAIRMETYTAEAMADAAAEQTATMRANGVEIAQFPEAVAARLPDLFAEGTTAVARKSDPEAVDALLEFARSRDALAQ